MDDDRHNERMAHKLKENGTVDRLQQSLLADLLNDPGWMLAVRESVRESASHQNDNTTTTKDQNSWISR
jgi:hypothetical protein